MTYQNIIIMADGSEVDYNDLPKQEQREITNALNRRALTKLGYEEIKSVTYESENHTEA